MNTMDEVIEILNKIKNHPNAKFNVAACRDNDPTIGILIQETLELLAGMGYDVTRSENSDLNTNTTENW